MKKLFTLLALFFLALFSIAARASQWSKVRKAYLKAYPTCAVCDSKKKLQVHHIIPFAEDKSLELEPSNLITLCSRCHLLFGHFGSYKKYNPNVREDAEWFRKRMKNAKIIDKDLKT